MSRERRLIVLGSHNKGKLRELRAALGSLPIALRGLDACPEARAPEETGEAFAENARLKARELARQLGEWVLADDSGLCVDALGGRPGVRSARYAGPGATDGQKIGRLLGELSNVEEPKRGAAFVCTLALASPEGVLLEVRGACRGRILRQPRGRNGFGYDPVFFCPDLGATFAEVSIEAKSQVSHRGRALRALARGLAGLLERESAMEQHYVGIDLGGTNIKGGVVARSGRVLCFTSIETQGEKGRDHVLDRMGRLVGKVRRAAKLSPKQIAGVGIGSPGPLNIAKGIIHSAPNLPGWENLPLAAEIQRRCGCPVVIENDANAASLAEAIAGAGKGQNCMIMLTLGTGIGGGIVLGGRVWHGADDIAAELGHVSICYDGARCNCGVQGCVEAYASAPATVRRAREAIAAGGKSVLARKGDKLTCEDVFKAARRGDWLAQKVVADTIKFLAVAIGSLINVFNPDMIVLFGGMTKAGDQLFAPLRREVAMRCFGIGAKRCKIVGSELGEHAGVIGAAFAAMQHFEEAK
jgi:glucokinase